MKVLIVLQVCALMGAGPLDDQPVEAIAAGATLEKLWGEGEFTEGGAMAEDGSILFSDIGDRIMKYDPGTGKGQFSWSWPRLFPSTRNSGRIVAS